ncbi:metallophosphoesterase family protein [Cribrihabitans pelagius]|uniref:metallophosphoesterase family protein n=1 Tax=Cribrihabitans pelagius TaxID=1765746 RepID=UPI003B5C7A3E
MTTPLYAIGDIHGQHAMLEAALALIEADGGRDAQIVFLGDYVDRGPDSRGVIGLLQQGQAEGRNWICLKGNHDRMFEWFLEDIPRHDPYLLIGYHWLHDRIGGRDTLASYGLTFPDRTRLSELHARAADAVPTAHAAFLRGLPAIWETEDIAFAHAGIRPGAALHQQSEDDLLWIRQEFLDHRGPHPKLIVHGHTALQEPRHYGNRVNLDSGAGFGRPLTAAVFEEGKVWRLTRTGREPLTP